MVCKYFKKCTYKHYNLRGCSDDTDAFNDKHDGEQITTTTKLSDYSITSYKMCTGSLDDSSIAAIFFSVAFIIAALVVGVLVWKRLSKRGEKYQNLQNDIY